MARRSSTPDGDPLGRDRFLSSGGLWRISSEHYISLDDPVPLEQGKPTVRRVLADLAGDALSGYSSDKALVLLRAVKRAAEEIRRSEPRKQRDPRVQDVQEKLRQLRKVFVGAARKPPRDPESVAWDRIAQRAGVNENQLLDAVRYELESLPTEPHRVDPTPYWALDVLARAYVDITGERPTRPDRRSDQPSRFFQLVEASYKIAGFPRSGQTIDDHIRQYLDSTSF